jgi:hypothetical protein
MRQKSIEAIVRNGIRSFFKSLENYWPAINENDMSERNITAHVCHSFLQHGWFTYAEVSFPFRADRRLDMLALNRRTRSLVAIESKRLDAGVNAAKFASDAKRIKRFRLMEDNAWFVPAKKNSFGLLLAFTWNPEIKKWWVRRNHGKGPLGAMGSGWNSLGGKLDSYKAAVGFLKLAEYGETQGTYRDLWGLYAIYKLH